MTNVAVYLKEKESVKSQHEVVLTIRTKLAELGLTKATDPEEMVDIALSNGVAGSGTSQHSPLYVYNKEDGKLTISYEHINFPYPIHGGSDTYQIV